MNSFYVISDIHTHLGNLERFLEIKDKPAVCLGDIIGYNDEYDPNIAVELVKENIEYCIAGNWDYMVAMDKAPDLNNYSLRDEKNLLLMHKGANYTVPNSKYYNEDTMRTLDRVISLLNNVNKEWLLSLPTRLEINDFIFVHGGPEKDLTNIIQDRLNLYLNSVEIIRDHHVDGKIVVHGHTHIPSVYKAREDKLYLVDPGSKFLLEKGDVVSVPSLGRKNGSFCGFCEIEDSSIYFYSI